jgi:hypothetical protein
MGQSTSMSPSRPILSPTLVLAVAVAVSGPAAADPAGRHAARLRTLCGECHADGAAEGGLAIDQLLTRAAAADAPHPPGGSGNGDHAAWLAVWKNLRASTMPPADEPQPSDGERGELLQWVECSMLGIDAGRPDPGSVTVRRLNRQEYANTIRDLLGVRFDTVESFPADDTGHGFDTIGEVLSLSPMLMEKYVDAAEWIAAEAVRGMEKDKSRRVLSAGPPPAEEAERPAWLRQTLRSLADRGFRRPVDEPTLDRIVAIAAAAGGVGAPPAAALTTGLTAILASPRFLFRLESPVATPSGAASGRDDVALLDDWSLASRLSYFLWSSLPDSELVKLCQAGELRKDLVNQVDRMLDDPKSDAFVRNFVGQWLQTRDVETLPFDPGAVFGRNNRDQAKLFTGSVRRAMREQTELQFAHLVKANLPATDLLVGEATFLNDELAAYYGIPQVEGLDGRKMKLVTLPSDSHRAGLLTHASFLLVTSNPSRTSPVKRGLFVLANLLGTPAPPAPADVPPLEKAAKEKGTESSMRQLMELHRSDSLCASCHARMDPLGLALEHYNALGYWRDDDRGQPIDTAGRLITGERFADAAELSRALAGPRRKDYHRCLTEKLLTYSLGRTIECFDAPAVDTIVGVMEKDGRMRTLLHAVVTSVPFTMMRATPPATPSANPPTPGTPPPAASPGVAPGGRQGATP